MRESFHEGQEWERVSLYQGTQIIPARVLGCLIIEAPVQEGLAYDCRKML
jgi:hypothetical protein